MKKQNTSTISEVLSMWIDSSNMRKQFDENRLISAWAPMVGQYIASKTKNISIKNRIMFVSIDSSVVRNELLLAKSMLIKKLNETGGDSVIDDIIFK
ncbi:MAG: DUF721 domain-containing protein [Salinivirgaceae bacterium]|nr:DUF721 domain-containing protein [Salinivirgaceae bacterium]